MDGWARILWSHLPSTIARAMFWTNFLSCVTHSVTHMILVYIFIHVTVPHRRPKFSITRTFTPQQTVQAPDVWCLTGSHHAATCHYHLPAPHGESLHRHFRLDTFEEPLLPNPVDRSLPETRLVIGDPVLLYAHPHPYSALENHHFKLSVMGSFARGYLALVGRYCNRNSRFLPLQNHGLANDTTEFIRKIFLPARM